MNNESNDDQANDGLVTFRLSSDNPSKQELDKFREGFARTILKLQIDPVRGRRFHMSFTMRGFPGFAFAEGRSSAGRSTHTADMIENDDLILVFMQRGGGTMKQEGRNATIHTGEAVAGNNGAVGEFSTRGNTEQHIFRFGRDLLSSLTTNIDDALMQPIPSNHPALALMIGYANIMNNDELLATPELRQAVALHMHDLAALVLGAATRDGAEIALGRGVRAARLYAIKHDIVLKLHLPSLSMADIAKQHGLSEAYIRKLFAASGMTFSEFVMSERLARACQMLRDPRLHAKPIGNIALDVGFSDLSYFNRAFRKHYGITPSDARAMRDEPCEAEGSGVFLGDV
jgi:AraC-like DNA-binding protein